MGGAEERGRACLEQASDNPRQREQPDAHERQCRRGRDDRSRHTGLGEERHLRRQLEPQVAEERQTEPEAEHGARHREDGAIDQPAAHEAPARRPERCAHRDVAGPRRGAREHQARETTDADQEHDRGGGGEQEHGQPKRTADGDAQRDEVEPWIRRRRIAGARPRPRSASALRPRPGRFPASGARSRSPATCAARAPARPRSYSGCRARRLRRATGAAAGRRPRRPRACAGC